MNLKFEMKLTNCGAHTKGKCYIYTTSPSSLMLMPKSPKLQLCLPNTFAGDFHRRNCPHRQTLLHGQGPKIHLRPPHRTLLRNLLLQSPHPHRRRRLAGVLRTRRLVRRRWNRHEFEFLRRQASAFVAGGLDLRSPAAKLRRVVTCVRRFSERQLIVVSGKDCSPWARRRRVAGAWGAGGIVSTGERAGLGEDTAVRFNGVVTEHGCRIRGGIGDNGAAARVFGA